MVVESDERDEILRTLLRIAVSQETINTDLRTCIQELREFNAQQVTINERLETLMTRALRQEPNGRDA
jgi:hypothetical protein